MNSNTFPSRLTVITGPSGVGKGTLVKQLLQRHKEIWLSVSATTRTPREGEKEGTHYYFLNDAQFNDLVKANGFLEWANFAGNSYGTPIKPVKAQLLVGRPVLLEIELEGARLVRKSFPEAFQIFLTPPNFEELEKRIRGRGTDTQEAIQKRLIRAKEELRFQDEFDAIIVNDDISIALDKIEKLMGLSNEEE